MNISKLEIFGFKAFAKSLRIAVEVDQRVKNIIPSSKGVL